MATERIDKDVVVGINYRLTLDDGTEVDSTAERGPLEYLHGHGNLIPGLERALDGREVGDELELSFPPDEAYGERDPDRMVEVTRQQLGFEPQVGTVVAARLPDGREQHLMIAEVDDDSVTLDGNHPLAGQTLHFEVEVASLREPTAQEIADEQVGGPPA
ncbi:MAG TPA: peptidylprolyl isomerase [Candidatus Sulfomarinibacteraceae bacterium]|nr:peptidylprolyl isomerase [Candidatus Sulfomarinibacteraceae bacterium]